MMAPEPHTELGARLIASTIEKHWLELGFIVRTRIEEFAINKVPCYAVRSDMFNGYPVRKAK